MPVVSNRPKNPATRLQVIRGGRVLDPSQNLDIHASVVIEDGCIAAVIPDLTTISNNSLLLDKTTCERTPKPTAYTTENLAQAEIINAKGLWVCPAFIDSCHHLREPGWDHKGTLASETRAAQTAGFSHLICPPSTRPVIDSPAVARWIQAQANAVGFCTVLPLAALTQALAGERLSEMQALMQAGCVGVSNEHRAIPNLSILLNAFKYAATHDITVFLRPEEQTLAQHGCVHDGAMAVRLGLPGISDCAETVAISRDLLLIERSGVRAHFSRLSVGASVTLIRRAQQAGLPVTCDVSLEQLRLTEEAISGFNSHYHVRPPLRSERDRQMLLAGVQEGAVLCICSDHQPHELAAKNAPFADTAPGMSTLDTFVPHLLSLIAANHLTPLQAIGLLTHRPAQLIERPEVSPLLGTLQVGAPAQLALIDQNVEWQLTEQSMVSRGRNSPFLNEALRGRVQTMIRGEQVISF